MAAPTLRFASRTPDPRRTTVTPHIFRPMASHQDQFLNALAAFTHRMPLALDSAARDASRSAVIDSLAVALGALRHPAAVAARRYAQHAIVARGASLWGTGEQVSAEVATLVNGVPLRGYDYNDLYIGRSGGHPSDIIPGALAIAQWQACPAGHLLGAIALGYEVQLALFDTIDLDSGGWDYPVITAIGAACAYARLLGLTALQTREALSIVATKHLVSDEVESGELNDRGDLTMWKRFNGSNACRQALASCLLAEAGVEGAIRPFEGAHGLLSKLGTERVDRNGLLAQLAGTKRCTRIQSVVFKRWPVGSRAQSAIQAALEASASLRSAGGDPSRIKALRVRADRHVVEHLMTRRTAPYAPNSRETADHSLAYVVTAAILDGRIGADSFSPARVQAEDIQSLLASRVEVQADASLSTGSEGGFLAEVEVIDEVGRSHRGTARPPPGHRLQPFTQQDFRDKFIDNVTPVFGTQQTTALLNMLLGLGSESQPSLNTLCNALVVEQAETLLTPVQ